MSLTDLGVDVAAIVSIGAISEYIKKTDKTNKFKRFYILIPVVISALIAVGLALPNKEWASILINTIKYFGVTTFAYSFLKKTILKK